MEHFPTHRCVERDGVDGGDRPADGQGDPDTGHAEHELFHESHAESELERMLLATGAQNA